MDVAIGKERYAAAGRCDQMLGAPICLTDKQLRQVTGRAPYPAQERARRFMSLGHRRRQDGFLMVLA